MELIEPKGFLYTILLFLGGCMAFQPPEPVVVQAPRSVTMEKLEGSDNTLMFEFDQAGEISSTSRDVDGNMITQKLTGKDQKSIEVMIEKAVQNSKINGKELNVVIKGDNAASYKSFKTLINALAAQGLYRYKLVTDPGKHAGQ